MLQGLRASVPAQTQPSWRPPAPCLQHPGQSRGLGPPARTGTCLSPQAGPPLAWTQDSPPSIPLAQDSAAAGIWNPRAQHPGQGQLRVGIRGESLQDFHSPPICLHFRRLRFWEDPLEKGMATHSSLLPWIILCTEEPDGLQPMGLQFSDMTEQLAPSYSCPEDAVDRGAWRATIQRVAKRQTGLGE